jgi:hypothetical protein
LATIKSPNPITPPKPATNMVRMFIGILKNGSRLNMKSRITPKIMCRRMLRAILPTLIRTLIPNIPKIIRIIPMRTMIMISILKQLKTRLTIFYDKVPGSRRPASHNFLPPLPFPAGSSPCPQMILLLPDID